jgi:hypothetical protein
MTRRGAKTTLKPAGRGGGGKTNRYGIPEFMTIGGATWKAAIDSKSNGGAFSCHKHLIHVGTQEGSEAARQIFFHEVWEAILSERMLRYQKPYDEPENGHYIFVFNHDQFEDSVKDFYLAIRDILK